METNCIIIKIKKLKRKYRKKTENERSQVHDVRYIMGHIDIGLLVIIIIAVIVIIAVKQY